MRVVNKLSINFNKNRVIVHESFDLVELARSPIYAVMLLKAEHTLFKGSKNKSKEFADIITKGFLEDPEVLEEFLKKTLGDKDIKKQADLFEAFRRSLNSSYNESRYFGNIIFDEPVSTDLRKYLEDPSDKIAEYDFISSLALIIEESQRELKERRVVANQHLISVLEGVH